MCPFYEKLLICSRLDDFGVLARSMHHKYGKLNSRQWMVPNARGSDVDGGAITALTGFLLSAIVDCARLSGSDWTGADMWSADMLGFALNVWCAIF